MKLSSEAQKVVHYLRSTTESRNAGAAIDHAAAYIEKLEQERDALRRVAHLEVSADRIAGEICRLVDNGTIDSRSGAADALLDYAHSRHGDADPIGAARDTYAAMPVAPSEWGQRTTESFDFPALVRAYAIAMRPDGFTNDDNYDPVGIVDAEAELMKAIGAISFKALRFDQLDTMACCLSCKLQIDEGDESYYAMLRRSFQWQWLVENRVEIKRAPIYIMSPPPPHEQEYSAITSRGLDVCEIGYEKALIVLYDASKR